jgi:hypothetical protein
MTALVHCTEVGDEETPPAQGNNKKSKQNKKTIQKNLYIVISYNQYTRALNCLSISPDQSYVLASAHRLYARG